MNKFLLTIKGKDKNDLLSFIRKYDCEIAGSYVQGIDSVSIDVLIDKNNLPELEKNNEITEKTFKESFNLKYFPESFDISVVGETDSITYEIRGLNSAISDDVQSYVSTGTQFLRRIDDKLYFSVEEIDDGLIRLSKDYPAFTELIHLPFLTHEKKICRVVKFSNKDNKKKTGVLIVAGTHGDEWVPPDALIDFLHIILKSLKSQSAIIIGDYYFSYEKLIRISKTLDIFLFPQVNPDGRKFSHTEKDQYGWRKNRRINEDKSIGVDLNRNYDFLWNYSYYLSPSSDFSMSCMKSNRNYVGPCSLSEPETKNVNSLISIAENIKYFIDIHSGDKRQICFNWTNDDLQFTDEYMSFNNPFYSGRKVMGIPGDFYKEFVNKEDHMIRFSLANQMSEAAFRAKGKNYEIISCWDESVITGCSACYFDSLRYKVGNVNNKHGFHVECGNEKNPPPDERKESLNEITAALLEFCYNVSADEFVL